MILPDFILIEETIEKYNYDPKTFKGQKFYHLPVVRTCFICHSIYDQKFINAIYAFRKNKKCKFCANKERSIMSAESRSISMKKKYRDGLIHPMLGKIHTIETKNILSKNRMGKTFDDLYGEEKSNEIKQKLSKASTGEKNPFYNKKHNKETIEFLRENTRKSTRKGKNSNFYGKNYNKIISNDEFIKKCIFTHGNRYDYSKVEYKGRLNNIEIICKTHGPFLQKAFTHIDGSGCQKCNLSQGELKILSFLKENRIDFIQQFKFHQCTYW